MPLRLYGVSSDGGHTWTVQWLTTLDVVMHLIEGYMVQPSRLMK